MAIKKILCICGAGLVEKAQAADPAIGLKNILSAEEISGFRQVSKNFRQPSCKKNFPRHGDGGFFFRRDDESD